jgi:hypothetical protein
MGEINIIFRGSMSVTSKTQGKKLQREISLAQHIELGRIMKWSDVGISFGPEDHPDTEPSERNLLFMVKIPIGWHKVVKTLIDSGASLNLMMRKTFIKMGLSLAELNPTHDTFHGIILGQSSTPIERIDLEVSYGMGENKRREMLMFEVASFDIGYNYILGRPFLLKFMAVIHIAYTMIKMPSPKGVITLMSDQRYALVCKNASLTHVGWFSEKEAQELATKMAKTHDGSTPARMTTSEPPTGGTTRPPSAKKGVNVASGYNPQPTDQQGDDKNKDVVDKEVPVGFDDLDKKLCVSISLHAK